MRVPAAVAALLLATLTAPRAQAQKPLDIYFIDVEGGQATLFVTPSGESMLIDTGYPGFDDRDVESRARRRSSRRGSRRSTTCSSPTITPITSATPPRIAARDPDRHLRRSRPDGGDRTTAGSAFTTAYLKGARDGQAPARASPATTVPIRDLDVTIRHGRRRASSREPLAGAGAAEPAAAPRFTPKDPDPTENARSVGSVIAFGSFRMIDLGDLTWNKEQELVCPNNLLGTVDVYLTTHHGAGSVGRRRSSCTRCSRASRS